MEARLQIFQNNPAYSAKVLNSLADLFSKQGDVAQAITQSRRALALCEQLPDPVDRASLHGNLAVYLERSGAPLALPEARCHQLADLIYCLAAGMGESLKISLHNAIRFHRAYTAGAVLTVPRVDELLADTAFHPLEVWLRQRHVNLAELQAAVDQFMEKTRQEALTQLKP